jgi:CheY-like chemotaxis protein
MPYDLALIDLHMSGMHGLELVQAIKADAHLAALPLVLLTPLNQQGHTKLVQDTGVAACITKPVRQAQLFACLVAVLDTAVSPTASALLPKAPSDTPPWLADTEASCQPLLLVAEDNIVNQRVAVRLIEKLGYRVDVVTNGRDAVAAVERVPYAMVFMDVQMPEMDGYDATAEIRRREGTSRHTTIIAMTAHALQGDREQCLAAGMDDYLSKPVQYTELRSILGRWLAPLGPLPAEPTVRLE